jgi:hypothetical protein
MTDERPGQKRIVRLYQDDEVVVTSMWFVTAEGRRYPVAELDYLVEAKGEQHAGVLVSLITAATTAVGVIATAALAESSTPLAVGGLAVVVPAVAAMFCAYRWPPKNSLRANFRGAVVELYRGRDQSTFHKIARAVIRAREMSGSVVAG